MNTLTDYQNMTRAEVAYNHLVTSCLLFHNHLTKVTWRDDSITCDCTSNKSDRVFSQVYYLANIHDKNTLIELIQSDDELSKNTEFEFLTRKRRNYN